MTADQKKRILIVDDHAIVRQGLALVINQTPDLAVAGSVDSVGGALVWIKHNGEPDAMVVDLTLKEESGLDLIKMARDRDVMCPMLVLSMHDENLYAERALRAGANGYVMKEQAEESVIEGLRQVLDGEMFVSKHIQQRMWQNYLGNRRAPTGEQTLTDRELQIFELFGKGHAAQEIADALELSIKTIEAHRVRIKKKLDVENTAQLMQRAVIWVQNNK